MAEARQQVAGSQDVPLAQEAVAPFALLVNIAPGVALVVDVSDRAGRLLGIVYGENAQLQQSDPADAHGNPVEALEVGSFLHIWDPVAGDWNRFREGAAIGQALVDNADRAGRLVGIVYGSQAAQLQQVVGTLELITQDTGLNTNPERWLNDNHWSTVAEIPIVAAGAPGELNFGAAVGAGVVRRIREVTCRHAGSADTVVTIYDATAGNTILTLDVPAQSTITWSSQDGRDVAATLQPVIRTSDITGGSTFVSGAGVEA